MAEAVAEEPATRLKPESKSAGLVSDCRLMLSFARKNGFVLPPPLLHEVAWLDSVLRALNIAPVSQIASQLIWPISLEAGRPAYLPDHSDPDPADPASAPACGLSPEEVILDVHSKLSLLISPTTALSLQTSEPPAGKRHIFGGMPPLVQYVIVIAFVSAICFVISASQIAGKGARWKARKAAAASAASAPMPSLPASLPAVSRPAPDAPEGAKS